MVALRVLPPAHYVGAVEALGEIERFNQVLAERSALYELDGDVYFARSADPAFGAVARLDPAAMLALAAERGGDPGRPGKKDPLDPLVWLTERPGEPSWASAFGPGRPGWHVECAAIATRYLGEEFDVQAGGSDLAFPHHEMSASHARVARGGPAFARHYAHSGMIRLDGEKMSKSLGNLVFVSRLLAAGTDPMAIRLAIIAHRYHTDWDWAPELLTAAADRLATWRRALVAAAHGPVPAGPPASSTPGPASAHEILAEVRDRITDDLDAPGALAVVDRWAAAVLAAPAAAGGPAGTRGRASTGSQASEARLVADTVDALLGIEL